MFTAVEHPAHHKLDQFIITLLGHGLVLMMSKQLVPYLMEEIPSGCQSFVIDQVVLRQVLQSVEQAMQHLKEVWAYNDSPQETSFRVMAGLKWR